MACSRGHIRVIQLLLKNHQDIGDIVRLLSSKLNLKGVRQFKRIVARVIDENRKKRITIQHCQFLDGFKKACDAKVNDKASEKNQKEVIILLLKKISPENLKNICTEFQRQEKGVLLTLDFYRRRQRKFDKKIIYVDSLENPTKVEIK